MFGFILFLLGAALIAFAVAFFASRHLQSAFPKEKSIAGFLATLATLLALLIFYFVARSLARVDAPSADMGGLALVLEITGYAITIVLTIPCLAIGVVLGLRPPTDGPG